jgi:haloacetate dehalogenase
VDLTSGFFDGFELAHIDVGEVSLRVRHGGEGPPVLLLHGHPRTHTTWHRVAPLLAAEHTVVCPDLRGYGRSTPPPRAAGSAGMSKRAMAQDAVALMAALGHERFSVAGHDRGCYAALRTALDHPGNVQRLAVLDGVPTLEALERCDETFARAWWHWFFLGQTAKPAEEWINRDPHAWYHGDPEKMGAENHADWLAAISDPETVRCMVEDYRAGLAEDRDHDAADRDAGRIVECPTLFAYSLQDDMEELYGEPLEIWRSWAPDLRAATIDSGHHMAEEAPLELAQVLREFFAEQ